MYKKLNLFNGTILNSQHIAHIEDGIFDNSKAVEEKVAVAVETSYNQQTHVITFKVKNALGEIISTSTIDLPTESAIININDIVINGKKYLRFTTVNGSTFDVEMDEMFVNLVNEETFSNAIQNINAQISELQTDVANSKNDISNLKIFAENTNKSLANLEQTDIITNKRLANLESATLDFIEDSSIAYQKSVPENALPYAKVTKIGGMTRKCTNLFKLTQEILDESRVYLVTNITINGYNSITGTAQGSSGISTIQFAQKYTSGDYTLGHKNSILEFARQMVSLYDASGNNISKNYTLNGFIYNDYYDAFYYDGVKINVTIPNDVAYWRYGVLFANEAVSATLSELQVSKGIDIPYEPYFEGLRSAPVSELVSEGVNVWDEEWYNASLNENTGAFTEASTADVSSKNYISVLPNTQYYKSVECWIAFYDKNKAFISASSFSVGGFTTPSNCYFMKFQTLVGKYGLVYKNDIIIAKGSTALPYRPYFKRTLPIPEAVRPAHGINETVYDYIEWCEDGTRKKRVKCGAVDMGTLPTPTKYDVAEGTLFRFTGVEDIKLSADSRVIPNILCAKYTTVAMNDRANKTISMSVQAHSVDIIDNDYTDAVAFKAAMSGVMLIYELAEPEVTDISYILTDDNFIEVEGGGSITAVNEFGYDVPTTINYITDIGE